MQDLVPRVNVKIVFLNLHQDSYLHKALTRMPCGP